MFALVPEYPGAVTRKFIELDTRAETFGEVLATWPGVAPEVRFDGPLYALAGGRYVVWTDGVTVPGFPVAPVRLNVFVFDTLLGRSIHVIDDALYGAIVAVDTHRPRVFFAEPQHVAVVDARSGTIAYIPRSPSDSRFQTGAPAAYAGDADRLFMRRINDWTLVDVFDVTAQTLV